MNNSKCMLLVSGTVSYEGLSKATFKLIPLTKDCPYLEGIYHPVYRGLGVMGKHKKQEYMMMPTLDKWGTMMIKDGKPLQERRLMDSWHEYVLMTRNEIVNFINMFAVNAEDFDYKKFIDVKDEKVKSGSDFDIDKPTITELKTTVTKDQVEV